MRSLQNKKITPIARLLRRNMTKEEKHLWYDFLRDYKYTVIRQKVIGKYIVDFYCASARVVIEIDGSQHFDEKGIENDMVRTRELEEFNLKVVRFDNSQINHDFEGVCQSIDIVIKERLKDMDNQ